MTESETITSLEFDNGWGVDVQYSKTGFSHLYSTDFNYSVMVYHRAEGFTSFYNVESAKECFIMIADVRRY